MLIATWEPWAKSTGPKSDSGKSAVSRNAWKGGTRQLLRQLSNALREQSQAVNEVAIINRCV